MHRIILLSSDVCVSVRAAEDGSDLYTVIMKGVHGLRSRVDASV